MTLSRRRETPISPPVARPSKSRAGARRHWAGSSLTCLRVPLCGSSQRQTARPRTPHFCAALTASTGGQTARPRALQAKYEAVRPVTPDMLCAASAHGHDTCEGDSGARPSRGRFKLKQTDLVVIVCISHRRTALWPLKQRGCGVGGRGELGRGVRRHSERRFRDSFETRRITLSFC